MNLPKAPQAYDANNEQATRSQLEAEDGRNIKKNTDFGYFTASFGPIFVSPNGTRYRMTVDDTGAVNNVVIS